MNFSSCGFDLFHQRRKFLTVAAACKYGETFGSKFLGDLAADKVAGADHSHGRVSFGQDSLLLRVLMRGGDVSAARGFKSIRLLRVVADQPTDQIPRLAVPALEIQLGVHLVVGLAGVHHNSRASDFTRSPAPLPEWQISLPRGDLFAVVCRDKTTPARLCIPDGLFCLLLVAGKPFNPFTPCGTVITQPGIFKRVGVGFFRSPGRYRRWIFSIGTFSRRTSCPAFTFRGHQQ